MQTIAPAQVNAQLLQGFETSDDAAVYRLSDDLAAVLTVDFFTPVVDDPYEFGRVSAANSLSDVYAMGAKPLLALNLLALNSELGPEVAGGILQGGADAVAEAGACVAGGHTVDDNEPKYGLCVFGTVHPDRVVRNGGALPGDVLYLTKPLGVGIMAAGYKVGMVSDEAWQPVVDSMCELNRAGGEAMLEAGVRAATDVTGFGLAGHLHEMLEASDCSARLSWDALPMFPQTWELTSAYCRPNRLFSVMDYVGSYVRLEGVEGDEADNRLSILCDPETSGGLLVAIPPENAVVFEQAFLMRAGLMPARIGEVTAGDAGIVVVR